jgi:phage tail-like protein
MRAQVIRTLLPAAYQRAAAADGVLTALLEVMADLHQPSEDLLESVEDLFHPYRAPQAMVAFLSGWVAIDHIGVHRPASLGADSADAAAQLLVAPGRLRDLAAEAMHLAQWRGTAYGLRRTIEIATGVRGCVLTEPAGRPFHLVIRLPASAAEHEPLVRLITEQEKPAATTFEIVIEPEPDSTIADHTIPESAGN